MARILILLFISLSLFTSCNTTSPNQGEDTEPDEFGEFIDDWTFKVDPYRNFDVGEFRLWVPQNISDLRATLILLNFNNSNGLGLADAAAWQEFATEERLALLGVHFESHDNGGAHYSHAGSGSGSALIKALDTLAVKHQLPKLKDLPFLVRGYSAGGTFSYTFSEYVPERVVAFSNIRGFLLTNFNAAEKEIPPGIILLAGNEEEEKREGIAGTVFLKRKEGANWSYAVEPDINHFGNLAESDSLTRMFFSKILPKRLSKSSNNLTAIPEQSGWLGNNNSRKIFPYDSYPKPKNEASWLVDEEFAVAWKDYQEE